jgi:hypothetical protein
MLRKGTYSGTKLSRMAPVILYDNRLIHIESYIKPGKEYFGETLVEKGWEIADVNTKDK